MDYIKDYSFLPNIGACAVLHNLAIILREPNFEDDLDDVDRGEINMRYNGPEDGSSVRNYITRTYFFN